MTATAAVPGPDEVAPARVLFGRGSVYIVGTACQVLAGFVVLPFLTRLLDATQFGLVATALVVTQVVRVLAEGGLASVVTLDHFAADGPARARRLAGTTMVLATVFTAGIHLTGPLWARALLGLDYGGAIALAVWAALPLAGLVAAQAVLRAEHRAGAFVTTAGITSVVSQALGLLAVTVLDRTAAWYLAGVIVGHGLAFLVGAVCARPRFDGWRHREELAPAARLAWPAVPHGLSLFLLQAGDRVVIQRIDGLEAAGRYQAAYVIGALGISVLGAVNNAWAPLIYGEPAERRWTTLADSTSVLLRLAGLAAAGTALAAPLALSIAAPASYRPGDLVVVTAVVAASAVPYCFYLSRVSVLFVSRHPGALVAVTPMAAALSILLNVALVPWIGLTGAAVATVVAYAAQAAVVARVAARHATIPSRSSALRVAVLTAGLGIAAGVVLPAGGVWMGVRAALVALVAVRMLSTIRREWTRS